MKSFQLVVCFRLGAGWIPWRRRILPTVWSDSRWPILAKAPTMRSFVDSPRLVCRLEMLSQSLLQLRAVILHPAPDRPPATPQHRAATENSEDTTGPHKV